MSLLHRAKLRLAHDIPAWPPALNRRLMHLNRSAERVYGKAYARHRQLLAETEAGFDNTEAVLASVNRALTKVPFYRDRTPGLQVASLAELEALPFIDKDVVLANADAIMAEDVDPADYDLVTTGGTSGKPMSMRVPLHRHAVELATMHSLWARAGFDHHRRAVIRNHRLADGVPYRVNPITKEVLFDGFDLSAATLERVWRIIVEQQLAFVHCYPSTATELAGWMRDHGADPSHLKAFLSGSENVFPYQVQLIEGQLGVRFYNWYGHSEKLVLAGYCAHTRHYHHEPTYGYLELIDEQGQVVREPGGVGEIVGTSLHNPGMPLVRYRTGDFATWVGDRCEACGRQVPIFKDVRGRWSGERIYNADGSFVTTTALNLHDHLYALIDGLQYVQHAKGELAVHIVPSPDYHHDDELLAHFRGRLHPDTRVRIEHVPQLQRKPNGKFVQLVSTV